jgi:hypothetical protein
MQEQLEKLTAAHYSVEQRPLLYHTSFNTRFF